MVWLRVPFPELLTSSTPCHRHAFSTLPSVKPSIHCSCIFSPAIKDCQQHRTWLSHVAPLREFITKQGVSSRGCSPNPSSIGYVLRVMLIIFAQIENVYCCLAHLSCVVIFLREIFRLFVCFAFSRRTVILRPSLVSKIWSADENLAETLQLLSVRKTLLLGSVFYCIYYHGNKTKAKKIFNKKNSAGCARSAVVDSNTCLLNELRREVAIVCIQRKSYLTTRTKRTWAWCLYLWYRRPLQTP